MFVESTTPLAEKKMGAKSKTGKEYGMGGRVSIHKQWKQVHLRN